MAGAESLDDFAEVIAELEAIQADVSFMVPQGVVVPKLTLDFQRAIDFFWESHFKPQPDAAPTTASGTASAEAESSDSDYIPFSAESTRLDSEASSDAEDCTIPSATKSASLPRCRCNCAARVPHKATLRLITQFFDLRREKRRQLAHAMALCAFDGKHVPYARDSSKSTKIKYRGDLDTFVLFGVTICRKFFRSIVGERNSGKSLLTGIRLQLAEGTFVPAASKYVGSTVEQHVPSSRVRHWLSFLADRHGLPIPHARWSTKEHTAVQLPCTYHKTAVYRLYCADIGDTSVSQGHFLRIWRDDFSWLRVCDKYTDYCNTCYHAKSTSDGQALVEHLSYVKLQQAFIRSFMDSALSAIGAPDVRDRARWLSMDFAQSIRLPWFCAFQPGQSFFQSGLTIDIFGVVDDIHRHNSIFLMPEGHCGSGKDANTILSILYWYLLQPHADSGCGTLILHGDNCAGQLKNRYLVWFCAWLLTQPAFQHIHNIHVLYNLPGHTKFSPDRAFAAVKRELRQVSLFSPAAVLATIRTMPGFSCHCMSSIQTYDWRRYLSTQFHKSITHITLTTHWHFARSELGCVTSREYATDTNQNSDLGRVANCDDVMLSEFLLQAEPLTQERRDELATSLRGYGDLIDVSTFMSCACH
jgi:hypothetical protein